jgi:sodium-dependent dicarboxylate transporter 2/3/5
MGISRAKWLSIISGPFLFFVIVLFVHPSGMSEPARMVLASTLWVAAWWITEAIPIPVTSLLPLILLPLTGAAGVQETAEAYADPIIFLYVGGFIIAAGIEKWNLHKRIALLTIARTGSDARFIVLGFMLATALLSMWISNTATTVMMLPIGLAVISQLGDTKGAQDFGKALMLGIAYAASLGGMATLIGTPTNLVFAGIVRDTYQTEITFTQWMAVGLPVSIVLLALCWVYLTRFGFRLKGETISGGRQEIARQIKTLGGASFEEKAVAVVFVFTALCWVSRSILLKRWFPAIDDSMIAVAGATLLFLIPSKRDKGSMLINWKEAVGIPWGIILLFGGGLAIAAGFQSSGLAVWIGNQMTLLQGIPILLLMLIVVTCVTALSELASNVATAAMILPVLIAISAAIGVNPYVLLVSATLAASIGFMLPVATPPNAVVFGSGYLKIRDMMRAGIWMDVMCILIVSLYMYFFLPLLWHQY